MIFVTLGTFLSPFERPLRQLDELCEKKSIDEEIIVQCGHTVMDTDNLKMIPFMAPSEMEEYFLRARIVITHAGTGSLVQPVKMGKQVIAIPRLYALHEHVDNHQLDIFEKFVEYKYVYPWRENDNLEDVLQAVQNFKPNKFISTRENLVSFLKNYIDSL